MTNAHDQFRNELLQETVHRAVEGSTFYRSRFSSLDWKSVRTVDNLHILPTMCKQDVQHARQQMLCSGLRPSHVQYTSGTTSKPLLLYRSFEETQFIRDFFREVHRPIQESFTGPTPIVLCLVIPHHGTATPVPGTAFVLTCAVSDDDLLEQTLALLETEFRLPGIANRVSALAGSFSQILTLTNYFLERRIDARAYGIKLIELTGNYLTPRWRLVLEDVWGCKVSDRYSLAEIFGGASSCTTCGGFHFDPHVIPELLDLSKGQPLREGLGALVMTSLHPFVQLQPFIRYQSGDLFERVEVGCASPTWRFMGRLSHSLLDPRVRGRILIPAAAIFDSIDHVPDLARTFHFKDVAALQNHQAPGRAFLTGRVSDSGNDLDIVLKIRFSYEPALFDKSARAAAASMRDGILANSPNLREDLASGNATFRVEPTAGPEAFSTTKTSTIWTYH